MLIVIGLYFVLWGKSSEKKATASSRNLLQDQLAQGGDMTTHLLLDGGEAEASVKDDEEAPATTDLLA